MDLVSSDCYPVERGFLMECVEMDATNYSRQVYAQFTEMRQHLEERLGRNHVSYLDMARMLELCRVLHKSSVKFTLPDGGRVINDLDMKALDETQPLRLPFSSICLEYRRVDDTVQDGQVFIPKQLIYAMELENGNVMVIPVSWYTSKNIWAFGTYAVIPKTGYIDRSLKINGHCGIKAWFRAVKGQPAIQGDVEDEVGAVVSFCNALACSNVEHEVIQQSRKPKKNKDALQFDEYRVLTVACPAKWNRNASLGGTHRSPREHLRRGHIRRLQNGTSIWVNAAVVNAGVGGKISKTYKLSSGVNNE